MSSEMDPPHTPTGSNVASTLPAEINHDSAVEPTDDIVTTDDIENDDIENDDIETIIREAVKGTESTPIRPLAAVSHFLESSVADRSSLNERLAREMKGHFVGAPDPQFFLDQYFPLQDATNPGPTSEQLAGQFNDLAACSETVMYTEFVNAVTPYMPGLVLFDTHSKPDSERDGLKPDCSVYYSNDLPNSEKPTDFSKMLSFIEFKGKPSQDPFKDPIKPDEMPRDHAFEHNGIENTHNRGQIGAYSAAISGTQFRVKVFSVSIYGPTARFIRWDRSGAVVTRQFNYAENPHLLAGFFWRYARATLEQQGYDSTVTAATNEEIALMDEATQDRMVAENSHHREFRKMLVPDREDPTVEKPVLFSYPPHYECRSPFSRSTRAMLVFDLTLKKFSFLKDFWRPNTADIEKEGDIYKILEDKEVKNTAAFGMGNDVRDHETVTQDLASRTNLPWLTRGKRLTPLRHYRMTLNNVGRGLSLFKSSHEFISAIADAMEAHDEAYHKAGILHRDISIGNIMFRGDGKGMLLDWDLCIKLAKDPTPPRRPARTGTWRFMSIALLEKSGAPHRIEDDRESAFWLILWIALRYTEHTEPDPRRSKFYDFVQAFDQYLVQCDGSPSGGSGKRFLLANFSPRILRFHERAELDALLGELITVFRVRHSDPPSADDFQTLEEENDEIAQAEWAGQESLLRALRKARDRNPTHIYQQTHEKLSKKGWLVALIRQYLNKGEWPVDPPAPQKLVMNNNWLKRKNTAVEGRIQERFSKSAKQSHGSWAPSRTSSEEEWQS
ncbi:hypothetical protein BDN70DRAFT_864698 [Pholiota conissans]|uniref:Fungal-type protein kinase domain-containing protein n=1 Tax=Pholiota conissans TaxID=109636 RepID=A0A9P5YXB1_9AGAR|nr:hypothetical protein BDN70DRAFT_864698 [Pholiota conissans]